MSVWPVSLLARSDATLSRSFITATTCARGDNRPYTIYPGTPQARSPTHSLPVIVQPIVTSTRLIGWLWLRMPLVSANWLVMTEPITENLDFSHFLLRFCIQCVRLIGCSKWKLSFCFIPKNKCIPDRSIIDFG